LAFVPARQHPLRSGTLIRRRTTRRRSRSLTSALFVLALLLGCATIVLVVLAGALRPLPLLGHFLSVPTGVSAEQGPVDEGPAPLTVRSEPPGAQVVLDGRARGRTPLQLHTSIGQHAVLLNEQDSISTAEPVDVAVTGTVLHVALWTRHPTVQHLRAPYP